MRWRGPTEIDTVAFDVFAETSGTFAASSSNSGATLTFGISGVDPGKEADPGGAGFSMANFRMANFSEAAFSEAAGPLFERAAVAASDAADFEYFLNARRGLARCVAAVEGVDAGVVLLRGVVGEAVEFVGRDDVGGTIDVGIFTVGNERAVARLLAQHGRAEEAAAVVSAVIGTEGVDATYALVLRAEEATYRLAAGPAPEADGEVERLLVELGEAGLTREQQALGWALVDVLDEDGQTERSDQIWTAYLSTDG